MKIGIVGLGFVGLSFAAVLASKKHSVVAIDSDKIKIVKIQSGKAPFYEPHLDETISVGLKNGLIATTDICQLRDCDFIFITVGTPSRKNGEIDLTMIENASRDIGKMLKQTKSKPIIIVKSTVTPKTTEKIVRTILEKESNKKSGVGFELLTNPEFLRETKAIEDTLYPHVIVIGGNNKEAINKLKRFYTRMHPKTKIITTNHHTAEMIKYANNSFLATKISFINQIASICESIPDSNVETIAKTIGLDPRIGSLFLNAGPGYGGSCLPKDVKAIIKFASESGVRSSLLDAVDQVNNEQIKRIISIIEKKIGKVSGKVITIFGLAFKADTDDIRDSVSIKLIDMLLKKNAKIKAHDPKATDNTKAVFGNKIEYTESIRDSLKDSYCAVILTPWKQYSQISNEDLKVMKKKLIVDSRRMLVGRKLDMDYYAIGIGS
jgi:UDPglucose 6-dehydrogenase